MSKKVKVYNPNNFNYGIILMDGIRQLSVKPKSFILLDEDEVYYLNSTSRTFSHGFLKIEDEETKQQAGISDDNVNMLSDEEIKKLLKGNFMKMKAELSKIEVRHVLDRVANIALELDLPMSKLKVIQEITKRDLI